MNETPNYIIRRVLIEDINLKNIVKSLKSQSVAICILAGMVCVFAASVKQLEDKCDKLAEEVEELKKEKGE